jgi:hypothetical protein
MKLEVYTGVGLEEHPAPVLEVYRTLKGQGRRQRPLVGGGLGRCYARYRKAIEAAWRGGRHRAVRLDRRRAEMDGRFGARSKPSSRQASSEFQLPRPLVGLGTKKGSDSKFQHRGRA